MISDAFYMEGEMGLIIALSRYVLPQISVWGSGTP